MIFREENPISSLTLLLGIPENVTSSINTNNFSWLFPNLADKRVEIVMMPKNHSRDLIRNETIIEFGDSSI